MSVPSIWIGLVEVSLRWWFPDGNLWFFSVFFDLCNDIKFIFIFMIGYGITAADDQGMKEVIRKGRWFYLCLGNIQMMMDIGLIAIIVPYFRGVTRQLVTAPLPGQTRLSELAMPFYLTHQQLLVPIAAACSWLPHLSKETRHLSSPIPL